MYGPNFEQEPSSRAKLSLASLIQEVSTIVDEHAGSTYDTNSIITQIPPKIIQYFYSRYILDPESVYEEAIALESHGLTYFNETEEGGRNIRCLELLIMSTAPLVSREVQGTMSNGLILDRDPLQNISRIIRAWNLSPRTNGQENDTLRSSLQEAMRAQITSAIALTVNGMKPREQAEFDYNMLFAAWLTEDPEIVIGISGLLDSIIPTAARNAYYKFNLQKTSQILERIRKKYQELYARQLKLRRGRAKEAQQMADEIGLEYETFDEAMNHDPFMYRIRELIRTGVRSPFDQLLGALNKINDPAVCYVQGIQQSRATLENIRSESSNPPFTNIDRIAATILQHTGPGLGNYLLDLHAYTGTQTRALVAENRTLGRKGLHKILVECVDPVSKVPISGILRAETVEDYLVGLISPDIGTLSHKEIWERRKRLRDLKRYTMKKATLSIPLNGSRVMATESQVLQDANIKYFDIFNATAKAKRIIDVTKGLGAEINGGYLIMLYPDIGTDQDHAVPLYITPHGELRNAVLTAKGELHTIPLHTPRSNFERLEMVIWQAIASRRIEEASCRSNGGGDGGGESTRQDALVVALNPGANRRRVKIGSAGGPQRFHKLREYLETVLQDPALVHYPLREPHAFNDALYREYEKLRDMYGPVVDDLYEEGPDGIRVDTLLIKLLLYKSHNFEFDIILGKEATDQNGRKYQIRRGFDRTTDITWRDTPTELRLRAI